MKYRNFTKKLKEFYKDNIGKWLENFAMKCRNFTKKLKEFYKAIIIFLQRNCRKMVGFQPFFYNFCVTF